MLIHVTDEMLKKAATEIEKEDRDSLLQCVQSFEENSEKDYIKLYKDVVDSASGWVAPFLSLLLYSCGVDPLKYMDTVPSMFLRETDIEQFVIPKNIQKIGAHAFSLCKKLKEVSFAGDVTEMQISVFNSCYSLEEITLPQSLVKIPEMAFRRCKNLRQVEVSDKCVFIGELAFYGCSALKEIRIPKDCYVSNSAFPLECKVIRI